MPVGLSARLDGAGGYLGRHGSGDLGLGFLGVADETPKCDNGAGGWDVPVWTGNVRCDFGCHGASGVMDGYFVSCFFTPHHNINLTHLSFIELVSEVFGAEIVLVDP